MAATLRILGITCLVLSVAYADHVPVLIWSSDRPLSDLPQAPLTGGVSQEAFHSDYLTPLLNKPAPVLVAFLQDKLHINDISKYADVYSPDSDGGAFKNIKGQLDKHFSLELPQVESSSLALDTVQHSFPGTVHYLAHDATDVPDMNLEGEGLTLIIVRLQPVEEAPDEETAFTANDELIGTITSHLEKRNIKYIALYTAEKSHSIQREKRESSSSGRHLLESSEVNTEGTFYNVSYGKGRLYAYLTSVSVCVRPPFDSTKPPITSCSLNFTIHKLDDSSMTASWIDSNTVSLNLTISNIQLKTSPNIYVLSVLMEFRFEEDRWVIEESRVNLTSSLRFVVQDFWLVTQGYDHTVPMLYSFHCSSMEWYPMNMSQHTLLYLTLGGFQVQPFNTPRNGFLLSQDCVGWFSTAVWMGLFPVALHVLILLGGLYMLASLTTNDRFDDPKGKPLTINAGE